MWSDIKVESCSDKGSGHLFLFSILCYMVNFLNATHPYYLAPSGNLKLLIFQMVNFKKLYFLIY